VRLGRAILVIASLCAIGCTSPESVRSRGGGAGADIGNRREFVFMHEGSRPFINTPRLVPTQPPPLDPASQADRLSRK
jgi:hypothetical protein